MARRIKKRQRKVVKPQEDVKAITPRLCDITIESTGRGDIRVGDFLLANLVRRAIQENRTQRLIIYAIEAILEKRPTSPVHPLAIRDTMRDARYVKQATVPYDTNDIMVTLRTFEKAGLFNRRFGGDINDPYPVFALSWFGALVVLNDPLIEFQNATIKGVKEILAVEAAEKRREAKHD